MRSKAGTSATDKASFEKLIDGIQVMVAILTGSVQDGQETSDYFKSVPCQHELGRAQENGTPVVFVLESALICLELATSSTAQPSQNAKLTPSTLERAQPMYFTAAFLLMHTGALVHRICFQCSTRVG